MTRDGAGRLGETDTSEGGSETVWVSTAGSFYHTDRDCIRLKSEPNAGRRSGEHGMTRVTIAWPTPTLTGVPVTHDTDSANTPTVEAPINYEDLAAAAEKTVAGGGDESDDPAPP